MEIKNNQYLTEADVETKFIFGILLKNTQNTANPLSNKRIVYLDRKSFL